MIHIIKIGIYNKNIIKIYYIYIYMNYKNKYLKYKIKYIFLKKKLGGMYTPTQQPPKKLNIHTEHKDLFGLVYQKINDRFHNKELLKTLVLIKDKINENTDDLHKILDECNDFDKILANYENKELDEEYYRQKKETVERIQNIIEPYFDESLSDLSDIDPEVAENQDPEIYQMEIEINEEDENHNQ